ncbi:MAG TPA: ribosome silencing factor [Candidatus Anaerobiospirillum pullistercoris]|uniref:Ribosomal silencing factor RsfS n=1 Tax=Candidatus Anaerobiospirillum pullistercoris TaxID=2838452 RepID=A0A9D2B1D7_9GAMM|nr:ribosome silencing factor [Candidatus Anaerobiospirillum pullistercoris]
MCLASLDSSKALDIVTIDVHEHSSITDVMIITTGTSNRHVSAMADRLIEYLAKHDIHGVQMSGEQEGKWVVIDVGSVMVHVMQESERQRYQLENLYKCLAAGLTEEEGLSAS